MRIRIPNTVVRGGRLYWQAKPDMRAAGFSSRCFGPAGPEAERAALQFYQAWLGHRRGTPTSVPPDAPTAARRYPPGSIGEAWTRWIRSDEWARLASSNRQKVWWPAWKNRIEPVFADLPFEAITMEMLSAWRTRIEQAAGLDPAHKAMKVWRRFWRVAQAMGYARGLSDPSLAVINREPPPRYQQWREGEVVRLVKHAVRTDQLALATAIAVIWDTAFSPVDVRTAVPSMVRPNHADGRIMIDRSREGRAKSGKAAIGTLSRRTDRLVRAYLEACPARVSGPVFRDGRERPWTEITLPRQFRALVDAVFPGDSRQLRDMRRTAMVEAMAGDADLKDMSAKAANSLSRSTRLQRTYVPVDFESVRRADNARTKGRSAIRARTEK